MTDMHLFLLGFTSGTVLMLAILGIVHKYSMKQIEAASVKALQDLAQHSKAAIEDLADSVVNSLKK